MQTILFKNYWGRQGAIFKVRKGPCRVLLVTAENLPGGLKALIETRKSWLDIPSSR
jgi:hypothetical protein